MKREHGAMTGFETHRAALNGIATNGKRREPDAPQARMESLVKPVTGEPAIM